ncbi:MAG: hypothetical protein KIH65_001175 [Candidatus Uhrbacteria bacterium]|nr:hypothetical protein [Candidatus Uhrbacteria bacterium]
MPLKKKSALPSELEGVAFAQDVTALQDHVDKCYSSERYKEFQESVEHILDRYLKGKVGWVAAVWIVTVVGGMLLQKFVKIF